MNRRNVYIRKEDLEAWDAIPNKSEWIHNMLNVIKEVKNERRERKES